MRALAFASRNSKEILRDKLNFLFGLGFPIVIMLLLSMIQNSIPKEGASFDLFNIATLSPGIAVFGLSFISLFSGMLIAKDRSSSLMLRLFTSPMNAFDYIAGYALPLLPMALCQSAICFAVALCFGLEPTANIFLAIAVMIPTAIIFISLGLICGSLFSEKQVGGICGALLTNVSAWLSGTWFDLKLVGGIFEDVAYALPFARAVDAARSAINGNFSDIMGDLWLVIAYAVVLFSVSVAVFTGRIYSKNK